MGSYLVAGGCGFVGHRISVALAAAGHDVHIVDTQTNYGPWDSVRYQRALDHRLEQLAGIPIHNVDVRDGEAISSLLQSVNPECVIQLANLSVPAVAKTQPIYALDEIIKSTATLLEASRRAKTHRFVYVSSSMAYGNFGADPVNEQRPCDPLEVYGAMKVSCESLVRLYTDMHEIEHVIIRPTAIYGPTGNDATVLPTFLRAGFDGGVIRVQGESTLLDFTYVDDAASGIALAATSDQARNETFNIARGEARHLMEAANWVAERFPRATIVTEPRKRQYPVRGGLDISKAQSLLGFKPKYSMEDGMNALRAFEQGPFSST